MVLVHLRGLYANETQIIIALNCLLHLTNEGRFIFIMGSSINLQRLVVSDKRIELLSPDRKSGVLPLDQSDSSLPNILTCLLYYSIFSVSLISFPEFVTSKNPSILDTSGYSYLSKFPIAMANAFSLLFSCLKLFLSGCFIFPLVLLGTAITMFSLSAICFIPFLPTIYLLLFVWQLSFQLYWLYNTFPPLYERFLLQ